MSALDTLMMLAEGKRPTGGLLHTCGFEGLGAEGYGEEDIVERLRMAPETISPEAVVLAAPGHLAVFDGDRAYLADLAGENIARLWVLSENDRDAPEPGMSVVFDPDMAQARGDAFLSASDHPALDPATIGKVEELGREIVAASDHRRARAFAIRAFGTPEGGAALFAVYRQGDDSDGSPGFAMAAACWGASEVHIVRDHAGELTASEARWTPHVTA